jgi:hypothetical protein
MNEPSPPKKEIYALALICAALIGGKANLSQGATLAHDAKRIANELVGDEDDESRD